MLSHAPASRTNRPSGTTKTWRGHVKHRGWENLELLEKRQFLALTGVTLTQFPRGLYDVTGAMSFDAATQMLDAVATPTSIRTSPTSGTIPILASHGDLEVHAKLDVDGFLIGGGAGDDLVIRGTVDSNRNGVADPGETSGVLLTGEVYAFGSLDTGTTTDAFDFRFIPTGGLLMASWPAGRDIGVTMSSPDSSFEGMFDINFSGGASGGFGPINAPPPASIAGSVYSDLDNNGGISEGDGAFASVSVFLTGVNHAGIGVSLTTTTGPDGSFVFAGLRPGTYTLSDTPPAHTIRGGRTAGSHGGAPTGTDAIGSIVVGSGANATGYAFGHVPLGSISGTAWQDVSGDGLTGDDAPLAGVVVYIDANGNSARDSGEASQTTGADGGYIFEDLLGDYTILAETPAGMYLSVGAGATVNVGVGEADTGPSFAGALFASLGGSVYADDNNDGERQSGEAGIEGASITLNGTDRQGNSITLSTTTDSTGAYSFGDLRAGTYFLSESQPIAYLDGQDAIGTPGGVLSNDAFGSISLDPGINGQNNNFGELAPASLDGFVFQDSNNDGDIDLGENGIAGVTITLTGTDDLGGSVSRTAVTDSYGSYQFHQLRPGTYNLAETQPASFADGQDRAGTLGGTVTNDTISGIVVAAGQNGFNYTFAERSPTVSSGDTASIGFWHGNRGQALIRSLNGGANSTALGNWLAANFPHMYGPQSLISNLAGRTNTQVARAFQLRFSIQAAKLDADVFAVALATYVTSTTLAGGNMAAAYGFNTSAGGIGSKLYNVGNSGAAFGVASGTQLSVMQMLQATDSMTAIGILYIFNLQLRSLASTVYAGINSTGQIV